MLALAHCLRQSKQTVEAIAQLDQLVAKFPKSEHIAEAYFRLGEYAYADGNYDQAVKHYREAVGVQPQSSFAPHAMYGVGWSLFGKGDYAGCGQPMGQLR